MQRMGFVGYGFLELSVEKEKSILLFFSFLFFYHVHTRKWGEIIQTNNPLHEV
jgi:hypothetical protein